MGMTDTVTKEYMRGNKVFADAFNYLIYGGEQVVKPALLQELDTTEIAIPFALDEEENTTEEAVQKYRDVLKSTVIMQDAKASYILLGVENQTDVHYAMPVRNISSMENKFQRLQKSIRIKVTERDTIEASIFQVFIRKIGFVQ